jgi:DNA polymerase-1
VTAWVNRTKYYARTHKGINTLHNRWIPLPGISAPNPYERMHYERAAVNYRIQGSAAEILKLAMIQLRKAGYLPLLTVHDELLFEVENTDLWDVAKEQIKEIMENVVKLDVPLIVDCGEGYTWREAKHD